MQPSCTALAGPAYCASSHSAPKATELAGTPSPFFIVNATCVATWTWQHVISCLTMLTCLTYADPYYTSNGIAVDAIIFFVCPLLHVVLML
jgi:hypothetical protein